MKTYTIRGVPARLQRDGWWLDANAVPAKGDFTPPIQTRSVDAMTDEATV